MSVAIYALRSALGDDPNAPRYIETVMRRGYRFIAPVTFVLPPEAERPPEGKASEPSPGAASRPRWWVGRATPLEALESLLQQSLAGNRQVVFITGEAGIGKTTFIEMAMERKSRRGVSVLWGRCIEHFGTDEAFFPLIEALRERCGRADGAILLKTLRDHAPTWLAQMPGFLDANDRVAFQSEVFGATQERMLREFCELVEVLSSDRPLVIILEDLHWSDFATLDVLSRFARRDRKASVLVLATYRPIDVMIGGHPIRTLHQDLQIHGRCTELALDQLSRAEVEQYLALRFDEAEIGKALAERVFRRTQGQPLFVVSLVDYFVAQQAIVEVDGHWRLAPEEAISQEGMPRDLRDMITRQIDHLSAEEQKLLEAASAAGVEFSAALVAGAMNRNTLEVEQTFEALARKGHALTAAGVAEWPDGTVAGCYSFQHALYQEILYQRLTPGQRVQTQRRLGEILEAGYGAQTAEIASVLALHFEEGRDYAKAVRYLGQAAASSAKRFSNREAAIYLTRALGLVPRLPPRDQMTVQARLLQQRGWVLRSAGNLAGSLEDLRNMISCASEAEELRLEVNGLLDLSRFSLYADRRQCLEYAARAVARSQALDDNVFKTLVLGSNAILNLTLKGWRDEDAEFCRQTLKLIPKAQDPTILMRCRGIQCSFDFMTSNYLDCCVAATHGKELAQSIGDVYLFVLFNNIEVFAFMYLGEWRKLQQIVDAALAMTERNANPQATGLCHLEMAWLHAEALDFDGARQRCEETLERVEADAFSFFIGRNLLAKAYLGLHDYPKALAQHNKIIHRIEVDDFKMDFTLYPHFYHGLCEYWLALGDLARARECATRLYEITAPPPERTYLALAHRLLAKIAMAERDLEEAKVQVSYAVSILDHAELPLAAWRVYLTASELYESLGETGKAAEFYRRSEMVIQILAANFSEDDPLQSSLLAGFATEVRHGRGHCHIGQEHIGQE